MEKFKYAETNGIPICPNCKKPTKRTGGFGRTTCAYFKPIYDKNGNNINPDRNTDTMEWTCEDCGKKYTVSGNSVDGYDYVRWCKINLYEAINGYCGETYIRCLIVAETEKQATELAIKQNNLQKEFKNTYPSHISVKLIFKDLLKEHVGIFDDGTGYDTELIKWCKWNLK